MPLSPSRPETELLIHLVQARLDRERDESIRTLLRRGIDWDYFLFAAMAHAVLPLAYSQLMSFSEQVPADALQQLRARYHGNAWHTLSLTNELIATLGLLEANGIAAMPFKGPVLALCAYGDIGLRQFVDIDLFVARQDVPKARRVLAAHGFKAQFDLSREEEKDLLTLRCEDCFSHERCTLDIHWAIVPTRYSFTPDAAAYWARAGEVSLAGTRVPTLAPDDLFLLLCIHGAKHSWKQLNWICDLAALIRTDTEINWQRLIEHARAAGSWRMLLLGLCLVNDLLKEPVPDEVLPHLRNEPGLESLAERVYRRLNRHPGEASRPLEEDLFFLRTMIGWRDRVRLLASHFRPTPWEWKLVRLPRLLRPLYYILRPLRLAVKFVGKHLSPDLRGRTAI